MIPSLTSFSFLLKCRFLSWRPSPSFLKRYLTQTHFLLPFCALFSPQHLLLSYLQSFPHWTINSMKEEVSVFILWYRLRSRAVTHTWQISKECLNEPCSLLELLPALDCVLAFTAPLLRPWQWLHPVRHLVSHVVSHSVSKMWLPITTFYYNSNHFIKALLQAKP